MNAIIMVLTPKECNLLFNGSMSMLVRKSMPKKLSFPFKVYAYQKKHKGGKAIINEVLNNVYGGGKVVGEFVCDKTIELPCETTQPHWLKEKTRLSDDEYMKYLGHKDGKGLYIAKPKRYGIPKDIKKFRKPCPYGDLPCRECPSCEEDESGYIQCFNTVNHPPQSWCYVRRWKNDRRKSD